MQLTRIELSDIHHPRVLAKAVHDQLGPITTSLPVVDVAKALGVDQVKLCSLDGVEGMLITDKTRRIGAILANTGMGHRRARFTVAHELGHFLLERHVFEQTGFRCTAADLGVAGGTSIHHQQEAEANEFAISLLAPPYRVSQILGNAPDLKDAATMRDQLDISLEASVRLMINSRPEALAAIWSKDGNVRYFATSPAFPRISIRPGSSLQAETAACKFVTDKKKQVSGMFQTQSSAWAFRSGIPMREQTRLGKDGHAVTLLYAETTGDE